MQGTSLVAIAHRTDHEVAFTPPPDVPPFVPRVWHGRIGSFVHHHDGWFRTKDLFFLYVTETGGNRNTIRDDGAIYEDPLKQLWEVTVIFDNLTASRHDYPWESGQRVLPHLVKAYELAYWTGEAWDELMREECNYHRFRRHELPVVQSRQLRLRVFQTHGAEQGARMYEVRVRQT